MKRLTTLFAIAAISVASLSAKTLKTGPIYVLDGKKVENFDGSQLVGKTIANYYIDKEKNVHVILTAEHVAGKAVKKVSTIQTVSPLNDGENFSPSTTTNHYLAGEAVFVLDGKLISVSEFSSLKPSVLSTVKVIKDKDNADFKKYAALAKKANNVEPKCVVLVTSK